MTADYLMKFEPLRSEILEVPEEAAADVYQWPSEKIFAPEVWAQGFEGQGVTVGVVDGMVDPTHPQLKQNIAVNVNEIPGNGVDDDGNGFVDDYYGIKTNPGENQSDLNRHGTHVAGIIAADRTLGPAVGVAGRAKILPAQFINNDGFGSIGDAIVALQYLAAREVKIINMSWALEPCVSMPSLEYMLKKLNARGILLITAAGNSHSDMDSFPIFPSAYNLSGQISVAASDKENRMAAFSNYGLTTIHVAAPGTNIFSTTPDNHIAAMSGTSMSAPMVAGAAALLWSAFPNATAFQIKMAIIKSVTLDHQNKLPLFSGGVLNVKNALVALRQSL